ncbi:MAG: sigma factor-like helix-turn-helix DNA-binding protein [Candidatus Gracilibacteria bacterium]|nr:sigma factor-like helix-turn-helix DNA-binding protein [Candidatus Gracilibacteria bacterium]
MATLEKINTSQIKDSFAGILKSLTDKEEFVIKKRIGFLGQKETLQSIGDSFSPQITRERVRQIEDSGIKKIGRVIKGTNLTTIQGTANSIITMHGGVLVKEKLINALIKEFGLDSSLNSGVLEIIIQSDFNIQKSKPKLGVNTYFHNPNINKKLIDQIHSRAVSILKKRKDIMDRTSLYEMIKIDLKKEGGDLKLTFIDSVLDLFEDIVKGEETFIGLSKWKILNPKTLKDKAIYIMKKEKLPMHFVDIANKITNQTGESVKVNTIHNELIRNNEFVLIGRGIYALKEWGFKPGTVIDVIIDIMKKNAEPMSTEDIIGKVQKIRKVKSTTIYMNLQNRKYIERVGRNYYTLKN